MVNIYRGFSGNVMINLATNNGFSVMRRLARLQRLNLTLTNNIESYYEVGSREPVELMEGNIEISGSFTVPVFDERIAQMVIGQYGKVFQYATSPGNLESIEYLANDDLAMAAPVAIGSGVYLGVPFLRIDPSVIRPDPDGTGRKILDIGIICKPNNWNFVLERQSWIEQTIDFIGMRIIKLGGSISNNAGNYWEGKHQFQTTPL